MVWGVSKTRVVNTSLYSHNCQAAQAALVLSEREYAMDKEYTVFMLVKTTPA